MFSKNVSAGFLAEQSEFESIQIVDHDPELVDYTPLNDEYVGKKMFFVKKDGNGNTM